MRQTNPKKLRYYCCACKTHTRRKVLCHNCGSEDVFDKTEASWPCKRCSEPMAKFESICVECGKELLASVLAELFFGEDYAVHPDDYDHLQNPKEDYGAPEFRVFRGSFLQDSQ